MTQEDTQRSLTELSAKIARHRQLIDLVEDDVRVGTRERQSARTYLVVMAIILFFAIGFSVLQFLWVKDLEKETLVLKEEVRVMKQDLATHKHPHTHRALHTHY